MSAPAEPAADDLTVSCPECGAPATDSHGTAHPSGTVGTCHVFACGHVACACPVLYAGEGEP